CLPLLWSCCLPLTSAAARQYAWCRAWPAARPPTATRWTRRWPGRQRVRAGSTWSTSTKPSAAAATPSC
ncbi:MAG: Phosphoribosylformimino-5-aminoimidazole carboxamide ribotide isomerase @ Acting phosphoribosylanthranilate isomerase, partial [uncultured Nocardioidaceae bacterium]